MPYKMIQKQIGIADSKGVTTKEYQQDEVIPVSYTHLTLPTSDLV